MLSPSCISETIPLKGNQVSVEEVLLGHVNFPLFEETLYDSQRSVVHNIRVYLSLRRPGGLQGDVHKKIDVQEDGQHVKLRKIDNIPFIHSFPSLLACYVALFLII